MNGLAKANWPPELWCYNIADEEQFQLCLKQSVEMYAVFLLTKTISTWTT